MEVAKNNNDEIAVVITRGKTKKYYTEDEKKASLRRNSLKAYYRKKAINEFMKNNDLNEIAKEKDNIKLSYIIPKESKLGGKITELFRIIGEPKRLQVMYEIFE